jgi:hypothetical protein
VELILNIIFLRAVRGRGGMEQKGQQNNKKKRTKHTFRHFARWHEDKEGTTRGTREQKDKSQSRVLFFFFA